MQRNYYKKKKKKYQERRKENSPKLRSTSDLKVVAAPQNGSSRCGERRADDGGSPVPLPGTGRPGGAGGQRGKNEPRPLPGVGRTEGGGRGA